MMLQEDNLLLGNIVPDMLFQIQGLVTVCAYVFDIFVRYACVCVCFGCICCEKVGHALLAAHSVPTKNIVAGLGR